MSRRHAERTYAPFVVGVVSLALVTGCGKGSTTSNRVHDDTAAVVQALNAKNPLAARRALQVLDADLAAAGRFGQLDSAQVAALRAGVAKLLADVALITPTASPTPSPTPTLGTGKKKDKKSDGGGDSGGGD